MKKIMIALCMIVLTLSLVGCAEEAPSKELTNTAVYEDFTLVLGDAEKFTDDTGMNMVRVYATYTNNSQDPYYAASCFAVRAFQNDKELDEYTNVNGEEDNLAREIRKGETIEVSYCFALDDDSEVEILIGTPTADMETIGRQIYFSVEEE